VQGKPRQIIALGGGGFSMEPENLALDRYILAQARVPEPAVTVLPTASGDADSSIVRFYTAYLGLSCRPSHPSFFRRTPDLRSYLLAQNVIFVGGGNTRACWRCGASGRCRRSSARRGNPVLSWQGSALEPSAGSHKGSRIPLWVRFECSIASVSFLVVAVPTTMVEPSVVPCTIDCCATERLPRDSLSMIAPRHTLSTTRCTVSSPLGRGAKAYHVRVADGAVREEPMPVEYLSLSEGKE
jgi:hypothetical protein